MKAIVCGAGIAGLTVGGELARGGWDVTVIERAPQLRDQGYMIDFFGPGFVAAEKMGLLPRLRELAYPVERVDFVDSTGKARSVRYEAVARNQNGRLLSLLRQDLELALFESVPSTVELRFGITVQALDDRAGGITVTFTDATTDTADVLIGADGIHSKVRALAFGPEEQFLRHLGFHTCACIFDDPALNRKLGNSFALTDTVDRVVGLYALRGGRVAMFGAHRVEDVTLPADPRAAVTAAYSGLGWYVPEALEHCLDPDVPLYYDQVAQVEISPWSSGRVVLTGDASQAVSLLAGQGASIAVAGGQLLAHELLSAPSVFDAFNRYEDQWKPVVAAKQAAGRRSALSFLPSSRAGILLRRAGLKLMQVPLAGRIVSSWVAGKTGGVLG